MLFQPPNDHIAPIIPKSAAAEHADVDWEEQERNRTQAAEDEKVEGREGDTLYSFYGSLMDPSVLRHVLNLTERPQLKPASIVECQVKMWGP